ncbi:MAG: zf-HC2 domain-containing protein [Treponema sp.]|nr:zf-HC2 domain-containing protein [Treponema sp.]
MSTCPERDIHSVYLDGELPPAYVEKYKAHLETCPKCKDALEKLKRLRSYFDADKKSMEMSQKDLDDSFARLQARLSFSKHTKSNVVEFKPKAWISAALGAVAALAIVFLPARLSSKNQSVNAEPSFKPVADAEIVSPAATLVRHNTGKISTAAASVALILSTDDDNSETAETFVGNGFINAFDTRLGTVSYPSGRRGPYGKRYANRSNDTATKLASYDIFTPVPKRTASAVNSRGQEDESSVEFSLGSLNLYTQGE